MITNAASLWVDLRARLPRGLDLLRFARPSPERAGRSVESAGQPARASSKLGFSKETPGESSTSARSDRALLAAIAQGDPSALAELYDLRGALLFGLLLRILGDRGEAEDALQEVFLKVWSQAYRFDPTIGSVSTWLSILARNHAIDRIRSPERGARRRLLAMADASKAGVGEDPSPGPAHRTALAEDATIVRRCLEELPPEQRVAIELAYFDQLSQTEIAERLKQPLGTVKTRMRLGLRRLRESLSARLEGRP